MKKTVLPFLFASFALLLTTSSSFAQMPGTGVNAALNKLFGANTNFTGPADVAVFDQAQKEYLRMPMNFSVLGGKIRVDIDMGQMKSKDTPASAIAAQKKLGLDRITSIIRPDKKAMYIIFPLIKKYANMPMSAEELEASDKNLKVEKTALGQETIAKHPCVKNRIVIKDSKGATALSALTWNATDLNDFPVQIQMTENGGTTVMRFGQVKFSAATPAQFEPPTGFQVYADPQTLMLSVAQKNAAPAKK